MNLLKERYPKIFKDKDGNPIVLNLSEIEEKLDNLSTPRKQYLGEPKKKDPNDFSNKLANILDRSKGALDRARQEANR